MDDDQYESEEEDKQIQKSQQKKNKNYTIDDIMHLDSQLNIGKKKKEEPTITKAITKERKKKYCKKSQRLVRF
jgi:hypothetical protein